MARKHIAMCRHSREPWSEDDDLWVCKRGELIKLHNMPRSGDDHSSVAATSTLSRLGSFCLTPRSPRQHIRPSYSNVDRPHWSPRYLQEPSSASSGSFAPQTYQQAQHRAHTDASNGECHKDYSCASINTPLIIDHCCSISLSTYH
mgnify:CR=1 FL=1